MTVVSITQDVRGGGGNRTVVSWYRRWALEHLEKPIECFLDEGSAGWPLRARPAWGDRAIAVPRPLPSLHVPPYLIGRSHLRKLWTDVDEVHVVGAVALHGWLAPGTVPMVVWLATTIEDERRSLMHLKGWRRRLLYSSTLPSLKAIESAVLEQARRVLAMSPHTADLLVRGGVPASTVEVRTVPIDIEHFRIPLHDTRKGLLFVGRVNDPRKGFDRVVRLLSGSKTAEATGVDLVSRQGPEFKAISEIGHAVRWHGPVDDLAPMYQHAELLLLPSRQEGLGIVAFEALACGTPVVAYRCGGADAYLLESGGAVLVDSDTDFQGVVERLLSEPMVRKEMGIRGREWVVKHMDASAFLHDDSVFRP